MRRIPRWLRPVALAPLGLVVANSCAGVQALRDLADGLNNTANSIDGEHKTDFEQFVEDVTNLFD